MPEGTIKNPESWNLLYFVLRTVAKELGVNAERVYQALTEEAIS